MPKKKRVRRKSPTLKKSKSLGKVSLIGLIVVAAAVIVVLFSPSTRNNIITFLTQVLAAKPGGRSGGYNLAAGCANTTVRPCYDKLTSSGVTLLGKSGVNAFTSCSSNSAPNNVGEIIQKTSACGQEIVAYCHDGKSNNYIRKFSG